MRTSKRLAHIFMPLALPLFLAGCTTTITPVGLGEGIEVPVNHVEVYYEEPERPHETIGLVTCDSVTVFSSVPAVVEKCRKNAASIGADAFIVTSTHEAAIGRPARVTGKAIKWKGSVFSEQGPPQQKLDQR